MNDRVRMKSATGGSLAGARGTFGVLALTAGLAVATSALADNAVHIDGGEGGQALANSAHAWDFNVTETLTMTHLGLFDYQNDGFGESHPVGVYRVSDGALLASTTIGAGLANPIDDGFRYAEISPVTLEPGVTYCVSYYCSQQLDVIITDASGEIFASQVQWLQGRWQTDAGGLVLPENGDPSDRYGPSFKFDLGGAGYQIQVSGLCPGRVTVQWSGATPTRQQGLVYGARTGNTTIPNGPCQGTVLGIQGSVRLVNTFNTGNGAGSVSGDAGQGACGGQLQLVEVGSCNTSTIGQIP